MEDLNISDKGKAFMTSTIDKVYTWENVSPQHIVAYIFSGELILTITSLMDVVMGFTVTISTAKRDIALGG